MSDSISPTRIRSSRGGEDTSTNPESGPQHDHSASDTVRSDTTDQPADPAAVAEPRESRLGRFLLGCCGANPSHLHELAERRWYHSLGASVIVTSLMAGASAAVLASVSFAELTGTQIAGVAAAWAVAVFVIDRLIVSRIIGKPTFWNKAGLFISRFVLALAVGLLMAVGVELAVFGPEIEQKIAEINVADQQQIENTARSKANAEFALQLAAPGQHAEFLGNAVIKAQETVRAADKRLQCESTPTPDCQSGTGDIGYGDEAKDASAAVNDAVDREKAASQAFDDYALVTRATSLPDEALAACGLPAGAQITSQQEGQCVAQQLVEERVDQVSDSAAANTDGMLRRIAALSALGQGEHWLSVWGLRILIAVAVLSIDLIPLSAKLFGGATGHDMRARRDFIKASNDYNALANSAIRPEPHFLAGGHGGFHLFGPIGFGYRHQSAVAREKYYEDLFKYQMKVEQRSWAGVKWNDDGTFEFVEAHPDVVDSQTPAHDEGFGSNGNHPGVDSATPTHDGSGQRATTEPKKPVTAEDEATLLAPEARLNADDVLRTKMGVDGNVIEYVLRSQLKRNQHYDLWLCTRPDRPGEGFLAKCCYKDSGDDAVAGLKRDVGAFNIDSPHVIKIDSGPSVQRDTRTGAAFIVMPYYPHGDLGKYISDRARAYSHQQPVALPTALRLTRQLLEGLADAHEIGAVHCDIKPQNILLDLSSGTDEPTAVITDFGISKLMHDQDRNGITRTFYGSRPFAPIEQLLPGSEYGRRQCTTDLWAVGAVLFKMLVNKSPRSDAEAANLNLPRKGNGQPDGQSPEYQTWLREESPVAPRLDAIDSSCPRPIADLVARWLSNEPSDRVSPGVKLVSSREVMEDALGQLDAAMANSW